jgi:hypothetical protein
VRGASPHSSFCQGLFPFIWSLSGRTQERRVRVDSPAYTYFLFPSASVCCPALWARVASGGAVVLDTQKHFELAAECVQSCGVELANARRDKQTAERERERESERETLRESCHESCRQNSISAWISTLEERCFIVIEARRAFGSVYRTRLVSRGYIYILAFEFSLYEKNSYESPKSQDHKTAISVASRAPAVGGRVKCSNQKSAAGVRSRVRVRRAGEGCVRAWPVGRGRGRLHGAPSAFQTRRIVRN